MVKNVEFEGSGFTNEQKKWIEEFILRHKRPPFLLRLPAQDAADCWKIFEFAQNAAFQRSLRGHSGPPYAMMWEFDGGIPLFAHEVIAEISKTLNDAECNFDMASAVLKIPGEQIFRNIHRFVLHQPWASDIWEVLLSGFHQGMETYAEQSKNCCGFTKVGDDVVSEEKKLESSTLWKNHGDRTLRASYGSTSNCIDVQIWISETITEVRLLMTLNDQPLWNLKFPHILIAMEEADILAADALLKVRSHGGP